jgi:hypothetical protein
MLHQLKQHIEAVRQDFVVDEAAHPRVPPEVSTFHFRREMVVLERQLRHALIIAFGDASAEVRQYREVGFAHATAHGVEQCHLILDQSIAELEQRRLHLLEPTRVAQLGIDPTTDLYTEAILGMRSPGHNATENRLPYCCFGFPIAQARRRLPENLWSGRPVS